MSLLPILDTGQLGVVLEQMGEDLKGRRWQLATSVAQGVAFYIRDVADTLLVAGSLHLV
jgi:hypothetical protein